MSARTTRKRTPPPPPCLCEECKRETCLGIGKPLGPGPKLAPFEPINLDLGALDLPDSFGKLSFELGTFGDCDESGTAPARLAIARAIIRNADAGRKIPARVVKMARAEVERLS